MKSTPLRRIGVTASAALLALLALTACGGETATGERGTTVTFGLPTAMGANNSPLAVAKEMGYFEAEGIDAEIILTGDSAAAVQGVVSGRIDIGSTPPEPLLQAQTQDGPAGNLVLMYNYIRQQTGSIAVLDSSPIRKLEDFKGAVIGQATLGSSNLVLSNGILAKAGLQPERDFTHLATGTGAQALQALQQDQVDALSLWDTEYAAMEAKGTKLRTFTHPEVEKLFSTTYFSTPEYLKENSDTAAGFGRAMAKATLFTKTNPEAALRILYDAYPETRTAGTAVEDQLKTDLPALTARTGLLTAGDPVSNKSWGAYDPAGVAAWTTFAREAGIISKDLDPQTIYTNELVERINDFDAAAVISDAENWSAK